MHAGVGAIVCVFAMVGMHAVASAAPPPATTVSASATLFPKGLWTLEFYGSYSHSISRGDAVSSAVAGTSYYFDKRHALRFELVGYRNDVEGNGEDADDSTGGGANIGLRYHFMESGRFTMFFEGIAGARYSSRNFPTGGTHFNFNTQLGLGATLRLDEHAHLLGGARYMHISNARIHGEDENPSYDGIGGYLGVLFTY